MGTQVAVATGPYVRTMKGGEYSEVAPAPPMIPKRFAELIATKKFTSPKSDAPKVIELYERIWPHITATTKELIVVGWGDKDAECFLEAMPDMRALKETNIGSHSISPAMQERLRHACTARGVILGLFC